MFYEVFIVRLIYGNLHGIVIFSEEQLADKTDCESL